MSLLPEQIETAVAIVGMAGRFPQAPDLDAYWRNLCDGREVITFFSPEELREAGVAAEALRNPNYVRANGILEDAGLFDAGFFGFNPREAEIMDPQQRLFLECAWQALEDANYSPQRDQGLVGVYAGSGTNSYFDRYVRPQTQLLQSVSPFQAFISNSRDFLATLVSYKFDLKGPALTVQTACSTSLVAVVQACQSLLGFHCDLALAGGVSIDFPQRCGYLFQEGEINSPDGHCRAFDEQARGTVGGSGVGVVVLKRLEDALADGDSIHALILGSAVNNDGSLKAGFTAPSQQGQAEAIRLAQSLAGVEPDSIGMIEAHGTGTLLGDPIEVAALKDAFREGSGRRGYCALGSVKSNMGHADAAAGAAGLIKAVLSLKHGLIPPTLHCRRPNPRLDLEDSPFYINTELRPWPESAKPRRAGVSSFGIGGTNAHVVLQQAPQPQPSGPSRPIQLLPFSAKDPQALDEAVLRFKSHLEEHPEVPLPDAAYTLQRGRKAFSHRKLLLSRDRQDALQSLQDGSLLSRRLDTRKPEVAFLFPGQGAQYPQMAAGLYEQEPDFREEFDRCAKALVEHLGVDLRGVLFGTNAEGGKRQEAGGRKESNPESDSSLQSTAYSLQPSPLSDTCLAQPALFAIEYSLARLWMKWGVEPQAMLGHSLGEYTAACLAGIFSLEEALGLVAARGRIIQKLPRGAMLSVALPESDLLPLLGDAMALAAVNAPGLSVASGPSEAIQELEERLTQDGLRTRRLHTSHAFHSAMMEPCLEEFADEVRRVRLKPPRIPCLSNLSGGLLTDQQAVDPDYWVRQLRGTVRFAEGVSLLLEEPARVLLEVGPGRTLTTLALRQQSLKSDSGRAVTSMRAPKDTQGDLQHLLAAFGKLWLLGVPVDWAALQGTETRRFVHLPTYSFQRRLYWAGREEGFAGPSAEEAKPQPTTEPPAEQEALKSDPRPDLLNPYVAPRNEIEQSIALIWEELLGVAPVGVQDGFHDLGGHSLMAAQLISRLREAYPVELPLEVLMDASTVAELAQALEERLLATIDQLSEEEAERLLQ